MERSPEKIGGDQAIFNPRAPARAHYCIDNLNATDDTAGRASKKQGKKQKHCHVYIYMPTLNHAYTEAEP
jgi:hypothetical protein